MKFRSSVALAAAILVGLSVLNLSAQTPQFLWAKRVASTVNPDDELAIGMAMDSATNLYVTGWFDGTNDFGGVTLTNKIGGGQDIFVGKYNSNGALQWARRAGGSSASRDAGRGVGVDTNGNAYVAGGFYGTADFGTFNLTASQNQDFFLAKYNSDGTVQWVRQNAGGGHSAYAIALAVDGNGNSYAFGYYDGSGVTFGTTTLANSGEYNAFLVKYDNTGAFQWARSFNSPDWSYAHAVTLDSSGNVYVTGTFTASVGIGATVLSSAGGKDGFVAKFNSAGALQWARQMAGNSDDTAQAASVDVSGNVYGCGGFGNTAGDTVSFGSGITLTNIGGGSPGAGIGDAFLAKYNSSGTPQWARRAGGTQMDLYSGVLADSQGNIYASGAGGFTSPLGGAGQTVIAKYDSNGLLKSTQYSGSTNGALPWAGPLVDSGGNCYIAGWFHAIAVLGTNTLNGQGYFDYFLAKLAPGAPVSSNAPVITSQPQSQTVVVSNTVQFTAAATGSGTLSYQWRRNETNLVSAGNISGVTTTNLTIASVQTTDVGDYSVVVTNNYGAITSQVATLSITTLLSNSGFYRITDLGVLSGTNDYSAPSRINEAGSVVGQSSGHPFLWQTNTGMRDLGLLAGKNTGTATGINKYGTVAGYCWDNYWGWFLPFTWTTNGGLTALASPPAGYPYYATYGDINDQGNMAIMNWNFYGPPSKTYFYSGGSYTWIGDLGNASGYSEAMAINNANQIVGYSGIPSGAYHAFGWATGTGMLDLGTLPGGTNSYAYGVNESGHVVGQSDTATGSRAFLWHTNTGMHDLGVLSSNFNSSVASGLNNLGQVVGQSAVATNVTHAVLWDTNSQIVDLTTRVVSFAGWTNLVNAVDINDNGQIIGTGLRTNGATHAFILDPIVVSAPGLIMANSATGLPQLCLSGTAGTYCDIEKSTNLVNWTVVGRALAGAVLDLGQLDPAWRTSSRGFFRATLASSQQDMPPTITSQPIGVAASAGESASFVVAATGSLPLQYQWQLDGTNIAGATNASIVFTNLQPSHAGLYSVVITNVADVVTSVGAPLTVYSGVPLGDDFNGPTKDTSKWGPDLILEPGGQLVQTNGQLQFLGGGSFARPWIGSCGSYTQDWQVAADVHLGNVALTQNPSHVQVFLAVSNPQDTNVMMYGLPGDNFSIALDLYRDPLGASERSYETYFYTNWGEIPPRATTVTASLGGNLRIEFDSTAKTLSAYYDGNLLRTVNIAQAGSSWEMNDASTFMFSLGVGSGGCTLNSSDQVYVDNFLLYGSVPPPVGDDFNSPAEDPNKWGPDIIASPGGQLVRTNGQVQFLGQGSIAKPWVGSYGSYTQNWELILDVNLGNVTLTQDNALIRVGLGLGSSVGPVMPDGSPANKLGLGLGLARVAGLSYRVFGADIYTNGAVAIENLALTTNQHGSVRVSFDAATKTLTSWYAASGDTGAHHWTALKAQQINLPPVNWGMTDNSTFLLALTADCNGYTLNSSDQVYADNFLIYGSVPAPPPYTWTTNSGTITITRYTGPGGAVAIPSMITGLPVTSIGNMAFRSCTSLASVTIPISVTNIGYAPFLYCDSLTAITVDTNNPAYSSAGGVLFNKSQSTLVQHPPGKAGSYTIPDSVTSIGDGSFIDCTGLTNIAIPPSVTSIGDSAFFGCSGLLSIAIPTNLTNIGYDVFVDCTSLSVIAVNPSNSVYSSVDGVLFNKSQTTLIQYPAGKSGSSYTIPTGVISIGESAFWGCISLASVVIPDSVTRIGDEAFGLCQSLTSITLGTKVTSIGVGAFEYCFNLATVTIPSSVTMIGVNAFYDCDSLTKVYFQGNAPLVYLNQLPCCGGEPTVFDNGHNGTGHDPTTVYYLPGTSEWSSTFSGIPTALWFLPNPQILDFEPSFGVQSNGFSFIISWATNIPVVVEACTNLANSAWSPVGTNTLTDGSYYFSDPQWTNYARRFYRLRSP